MKKYLLCPKCQSRLYYRAWYSMSKKFVVYDDGSMGKKSIETSPPGTMEIGHYFCDKCNADYEYTDLFGINNQSKGMVKDAQRNKGKG